MPQIPDPYGNAMSTEGILQAALAQLAAEDQAQRAQMRGQIGGMLGDYGAVPTGYQDRYGILDPAVRSLAERNPYSQVKQLERQRRLSRGALRAKLAARGAIQSGEYAAGEGDIGYNFGLQNYQALRDVMGQIGQVESGYAGDARQRLGQQGDLYGQAIERLQNAGMRPGPQYTGKTPSAPFGFYRDPRGVLTPKGPPKKNPIGGF